MEPVQEITAIPIQSSEGLDPFQLVADSGPVIIAVLITLAIFSLVSWAIILSKWMVLRRAQAHSSTFLEIFRRSKKFSEVHSVCHELRSSPLVGMFLSGYNELGYQLRSSKKSGPQSESEGDGSQIKSLDSIARSLVRASNGEMAKLERRLGFLATTGSATPFIGLFGTVWGNHERLSTNRRGASREHQCRRAGRQRSAHCDRRRSCRRHPRGDLL